VHVKVCEYVVFCVVGNALLPILTEAQVKVPPPEIAAVTSLEGAVFKVTAFVTERVNVLFTVRVPELKVKDEHDAVAATVTLNPPSIITSSPDTGTFVPAFPPDDVDQVEIAFQLPDALE